MKVVHLLWNTKPMDTWPGVSEKCKRRFWPTFQIFHYLRLVKWVDSDENLNHYCGFLWGHTWCQGRQIMVQSAELWQKNSHINDRAVNICSYIFLKPRTKVGIKGLSYWKNPKSFQILIWIVITNPLVNLGSWIGLSIQIHAF